MKLDLYETHDRYQHFTKQNFSIEECCQDLVNQRPYGEHSFYIFAHTKTLGLDEKYNLWLSGAYKSWEEVPDKRLIWQPRLTKPKAQTNSMLFKATPGTDTIKIIWMIPERELWPQYDKGKVTESSIVSESIRDFQYNRKKLEEKEEDDLSDEQINAIYKQISFDAKRNKYQKV